jgi:hypothetical protein
VAEGCAELNEGKRLHRIHSKIGEVLNAIEGIQELCYSSRPAIAAGVIPGGEHPHMELIHDQIIESRWPEPLVVPWIGIRRSDDAISVTEVPEFQLARPRVTLRTGPALAHHPEAVSGSVHNLREKACPVMAVRVLDQRIVGRW